MLALSASRACATQAGRTESQTSCWAGFHKGLIAFIYTRTWGHLIPMPDTPRPVNQDHSINEVVFALQFAEDLSEDQLQTLRERGVEGLPKIEAKRGYAFEIRDEEIPTPSKAPELAEVLFSHYQSNGISDWRLRITRHFVSLSCFTYTRWHEVWPEALRTLRSIADTLITPQTPLKVIGLQYVDQFIYEGGGDDYRPDDIFRTESPYLTTKAIESGPLWHVHQGWFCKPYSETGYQLLKDGRLLNRLNINATQLEAYHQTSISHQMAFEFKSGVPKVDAVFDDDPSIVTVLMDYLHKDNKEVLQNLLSQSIQDQISLNGE